MSKISPLAHIDPNAKIGENVTIEPFVMIHGEVSIGDGSHIMSHAIIMNGSDLGKNCTIFPGAVIGGVPQDLKFVGEKTTVEIGDNTTIREYVTVNRGTVDKWKTVIGKNCLIMAYTHVAHDCIIGNNVILGNAVQLAGHVEVGDFAIVGGLTGVHQFTRVGAHTYLAGNAIIRKDVPPFIKAAREPLTYMGINAVGLERRGFSETTINLISEIYHLLFVEKNTFAGALEKIENQIESSLEKDIIVSFVKSSKTGIIRRPSKSANDENSTY